jgi:hypothetical protein
MLSALPASMVLAIWTLTGMFLGLTSSIYGAMQRVYRLGVFIHLLDGLWFAMAGMITFLVLVATNWGVFRAWTLLFLAIGYLFWACSAGPLVYRLFGLLFTGEAKLVRLSAHLAQTLFWHVPEAARQVSHRLPSPPKLPHFRWRRKPPQK